jgi:Putative helix-turn-helix protein, YlxM / p13 like.
LAISFPVICLIRNLPLRIIFPRQAVFDMVKRCNDKLEAYEKKLGLVEEIYDNQKQS